MKIAFFVHCFFPDHFYGTETYTLDLARHYRAMGHDVTVVTAIFQGEARAPELVSRYTHAGIPVIAIDKNQLPHSRVKETYYQPDMRGVLEKELRALQPDLVHVTHLINHTAVLLEVTGQLGIPTYATFTDFFGFCLNNKLEAADGGLCAGPSPSRVNCVACHLKDAAPSPHAPPWMRWAMSPATPRLVAVGANLARRLPGLRGGALDGLVQDITRRPDILGGLYNTGYKAAVAPTAFLGNAYRGNGIGVPLHDIHFGVDVDRSPKPHRAAGHIPVIGFIGQIAPHKGTDLLIDAFRALPPGTAALRIHGPKNQDRAYMASLLEQAQGLDVQFLGTFPPERMAEVLGGMDLLVIPSRWYENSPLVLLNALATHTPVLVSDVAGMTEFLVPGVNGDAFQRSSLQDLTAKLKALVSSPQALAALASTTGYDRSTKRMALDTFEIYQR